MQSVMSAVRTFFDERNRSWVTGQTDPVIQFAHAAGDAKWLRSLEREVQAKQRSLAHRRSRLLRAHSKVQVQVQRVVQSPDKGVEEARVDEHVTWVYRDGADYSVESRVIQHLQRWIQQGGKWRLLESRTSMENHPLDRGDTPVLPTAKPAHVTTGRRTDGCTGYDRVRALRYAELWWNGWNPAFPRLADDCTNFISQCLLAGKMPMTGGENRTTGWWYHFNQPQVQEPWSYSWTTSHALYMYLIYKVGAQVLKDARELKMGDLVFYDWDGGGRYHHTTIVTEFDSAGDPLVNAHTDSSYHRHYLYLDSRAWTPRTRYQLVHLPDAFC